VQILDIYDNAARVRLEIGGSIDYLHVAKWSDHWRIVNVLWARKPADK